MQISREKMGRKSDREPAHFRGRRQENLASTIGMLGSLIVMTVAAAWAWTESGEIKPQFNLSKITEAKVGRLPLDGFIPAKLDLSDSSKRRLLAQKP